MAVSSESDAMTGGGSGSSGGDSANANNDGDATLLDLSQSTWRFILEEQQNAPAGSPKAAMAADAIAAGGQQLAAATAAKLTDSEAAMPMAIKSSSADLKEPAGSAGTMSPISPVSKGHLPMAPMRPKSKSAEPPRKTRPAISSENLTSYIEVSDQSLDDDIVINISDDGRFFFFILLF